MGLVLPDFCPKKKLNHCPGHSEHTCNPETRGQGESFLCSLNEAQAPLETNLGHGTQAGCQGQLSPLKDPAESTTQQQGGCGSPLGI